MTCTVAYVVVEEICTTSMVVVGLEATRLTGAAQRLLLITCAIGDGCVDGHKCSCKA